MPFCVLCFFVLFVVCVLCSCFRLCVCVCLCVSVFVFGVLRLAALGLESCV